MRQVFTDDMAAGGPKDIADEKNIHFESVARVVWRNRPSVMAWDDNLKGWEVASFLKTGNQYL